MDIQTGKFIKLLITSHTKNAPLSKKTAMHILKSTRQEFSVLLNCVKAKLREYELRLIGINKNEIVDVEDADRYFLTKYYNINEIKGVQWYFNEAKEEKNNCSTNVKESDGHNCARTTSNPFNGNNCNDSTCTVGDTTTQNIDEAQKPDINVKNKFRNEYLAIFIVIYLESSTLTLEKLIYFIKMLKYPNMDERLNDLRRMHYIMYFKREETVMVTFDWRFYAEFPCFDPTRVLERFFCGV